MAYALVGSIGTVSSGTTSVTPAFAQATTAGNLLIAWVGNNLFNDTISVSGATGWAIAQTGTRGSILYKKNCGASEAAPTFTGFSGATLFAALAEFSGGNTTAPLDQTGNSINVTSSPATATAAAADTASGELLISVGGWNLSKAGTCTTGDTYNNGATPTGNLNNDSTSSAFHYRFAWGATTGNSAADSDTQTNSSMNISNGGVTVASFLLAAGAPAASLIYADRRVARNSLVRR